MENPSYDSSILVRDLRSCSREGFSQFSQDGMAMRSSYRHRLGSAKKGLGRPCENLGARPSRVARPPFLFHSVWDSQLEMTPEREGIKAALLQGVKNDISAIPPRIVPPWVR